MSKTKFSLGDILVALQVLGSLFDLVAGFMTNIEKDDIDGPTKKEATMTFIEGVLGEAKPFVKEITDGTIATVKVLAGGVINAFVAAKNLAGVFKHRKDKDGATG